MSINTTTPTAVALGRELKARREALGWSKHKLADKAGVSMAYMYELERGVKEPRLSVLRCLARALGTTAGALLTGAEQR